MSVQIVRLGEICEINPRLPRDHSFTNDTQVSFVPMAAVDEVAGTIRDRQSRPFGEVKKGYTSFRNGDVLFAKITPCMENGKAAVANDLIGGVGFGSTEFHVLRAMEVVLPEWLYYFVRRECFRREAKRSFAGTAGQQRVPSAFLAEAEIPLPTVIEQRRVIDLLSRAEGIVRLRREARKKAQQIIPALFLDMFGDPATNPKGWPIVTLGDLLTEPPILGTMTKPSQTEGKWLDLRVANIQEGQLTLTDKKWVDLPDNQAARFALRPYDILLARAIGSLDHLGKAVIIDPKGDWTFDSHLMRVRLDFAKLLPETLKAFLESRSGRDAFLKRTRRSAVQFNINGKELRLIELPLPPIALQLAFRDRVRRLRSVQFQQAEAAARAESIFNALLARVFSESEQERNVQSEKR